MKYPENIQRNFSLAVVVHDGQLFSHSIRCQMVCANLKVAYYKELTKQNRLDIRGLYQQNTWGNSNLQPQMQCLR